MKKKIWIVIGLVAFLIILWCGYELYKYYNPDGSFVVGQPLESTDMYIENLSFTVKGKSIFGYSSEASEKLFDKASDVLDGANEIRSKILEEYAAPMHVNIVVNVNSEKIKVLFEGIGTEKSNGNEEIIHIEKEFPCMP